jgi:hypothetical protein
LRGAAMQQLSAQAAAIAASAANAAREGGSLTQ